MKYCIQIISVSLLVNQINSASVELFLLHFILLDELTAAPCPKVTRLPVWPWQSYWIWCDLSTYQCTANLSWSTHIVSFKYRFLLQFLVIERSQGSPTEWRWTLTNYSTFPTHKINNLWRNSIWKLHLVPIWRLGNRVDHGPYCRFSCAVGSYEQSFLFPSKWYYLGSERAAIDPSTANLGDCGLFSYFVRW